MRIHASSWPDNFYEQADSYNDVMFLAKISKWDDVRYSLGLILENIGKVGDLASETAAILRENDLDALPFPPEVYQFLPKTGAISEDEITKRLDLRKECIFTIGKIFYINILFG